MTDRGVDWSGSSTGSFPDDAGSIPAAAASEQPTLFRTESEIPAHCLRPARPEPVPPSAAPGRAPTSIPSSPGPRARRRRIRKWSRDARGRRVASVQYQVLRLLADRGFITSGEILHHDDDRFRSSAKQRLRDCRLFGIDVLCDEFGDRSIWRVAGESRRRAAELVRRADVR